MTLLRRKAQYLGLADFENLYGGVSTLMSFRLLPETVQVPFD